MRILILVDCYLPSLKSGARLVHDLAVEIRSQAEDVIVLTPSDSIREKFQVTTEEDLKIARIRVSSIKGAPRPLRAIREIRLSTAIWSHARQFFQANRADLIIFYSPTIFFGSLVRRLKATWNCPSYLILRDIFPQWAVDAGLLKKGLAWRYFRSKEIEQYDAADVIGVESPANLRYFTNHFGEGRYKLEVLYNWANPERCNPITNYREKLNLQDKVVFLYGGNIGVVQDLENIVRLAEALATQTAIQFLLVGEGTETTRIKRLIADRNLRNIQVLPALPEPEYMGLLAEADVGLISLDRRLKTHNTTGKLLGYMLCGKPTLASVNPGNDLYQILGGARAGFCVSNGDDQGLVAAASSLAKDPQLRLQMGANARRLLERQFSSRSAARQICGHFASSTARAKEQDPGQDPFSIVKNSRLRAEF